MTKDEYLAGAATPMERDAQAEREAYMTSDEYMDEIMALMDMDAYEGPTGDA